MTERDDSSLPRETEGFPLCGTAVELAELAHGLQRDKGGEPYMLHVRHVAQEAAFEAIRLGYDHHWVGLLYAAGLLHDVVEDSGATLTDVHRVAGPGVAHLVDRLTKRPGDSRQEYLRRIRANRDATIIKRADLRHNMDLSRISRPTMRDHARADRYCQELLYLTAEGKAFGLTLEGGS